MSRVASPVRWVQPFVIPIAARRLRRHAAAARSLDEIIGIAYEFQHLGIRITPWQVRGELRRFLEIVEADRPRIVLEIGTAAGGTLFCLAHAAHEEALLVSIDLRHGEFGGGYPAWRQGLYKSFARPRQRVVLLRGNSHEAAMLQRVRSTLGETGIECLLIDGDHTYEGVSSDFELYSPFVGRGGIVALHDIVPQQESEVPHPALTCCSGDVPRFWSEIRSRYEATELVHDWAQGGFGIGVLRWPGAPSSPPPHDGGGRSSS